MNEPDLLHADAPWRHPAPGRFLGRGHPTGEFLEAHEWHVVEQRPGYYKLDVHLPAQVQNLRGELFGGFSPTYIDLVSLRTAAGLWAPGERGWTVTVSMHVDYLAPVTGPRFFIECEVIHERQRSYLIETRFRDAAGELLLFATTTLRRKKL